MQKPTVLFLCTANAARSQMAEAFLRHYASDRLEVYSAGTDPTELHPLTARVMAEVGICMDGHRSKSLKEYLGHLSVTHAIIVCEEAEQRCPKLWPFALQRLVWPFPDPILVRGTEEIRLQRFRDVREQIRRKVVSWLAERD